MGKLIAGPADGLDCQLSEDAAWVAVIEGEAIPRPDYLSPDAEAIFNAARGKWAYYRRVPSDLPAEEAEWQFQPRNWP